MDVLASSQSPLRLNLHGTDAVLFRLRVAAAAAFYFSTIMLLNVLQTSSLVIRPFSPRLFRRVNRWCADSWWGWCVIGAEKILGVELVLTGDDVPAEENAIVFANHQQMPDILVVMMLAWRKRRLGDMKWFVKDPIKFVPGIGWGMLFLDCLFVKRDWMADKKRVTQTFEKFFTNNIPIWLITFVEGTRLTATKLAKSQMFAKQRGMVPLKHVMLPKTKGFTAALEGLSGHVGAVYDLTIGYEGGVPKLSQVYGGLVKRVHLDVRRFEVADLPTAEPERAAWLHERFQRKDAVLDAFFKAGSFPA